MYEELKKKYDKGYITKATLKGCYLYRGTVRADYRRKIRGIGETQRKW